MSDDEIGSDPMDDISDDVSQDIAATKVRHILEDVVQPRIGFMLERTQRDVGKSTIAPIRGCSHLVEAPDADKQHLAFICWMCEGVGLLCRDCAFTHLTDESGPHQDPRHESCIVCGYEGEEVKPLYATVELGQGLMVSSPALDAVSEIRGELMACGYTGTLITTPIAWECPKHDGFFDSEITLRWPGLAGPVDITVEDDSAARFAARKAKKAKKAAAKQEDAKKAGNAKAKRDRRARRRR